MLISQTFRGSPTLDQTGYRLLQKWYRLKNEEKHRIIKEVLADGLRGVDAKSGTQIKDDLARAIDQAVSDAEIAKLNY